MGKYQDEMDKLNDTKKGKPVDKPKKCQYVNCPMLASTSAGGSYRCSFHESGHYHGEVTMAIRENKNFIKAYNAMLKWDTSEWHKQDNWLKTNKNCPMGKNDPPSIYLVKFFNWLSEKIKADATRHVESRVGHETGA